MSSNSVIIVCDAHIGPAQHGTTTRAFHRFLEEVPKRSKHLIVNGDLFDFWFEYRSVVPRAAFPTLAALAEVVRAGVRVTITGGNHDRWGGPFWTEQLGAEYHAKSVELDLAGWRALVSHGDGECEPEFLARLLHRTVGHPLTSLAFRALHPDIGFWLVKRMGKVLNRPRDDGIGLRTASEAQSAHAIELLQKRPDLDLVVFGHTHRARLELAGGGEGEREGDKRWYLNPGAWMDRQEYAVVTEDGPELCRWG